MRTFSASLGAVADSLVDAITLMEADAVNPSRTSIRYRYGAGVPRETAHGNLEKSMGVTRW